MTLAIVPAFASDHAPRMSACEEDDAAKAGECPWCGKTLSKGQPCQEEQRGQQPSIPVGRENGFSLGDLGPAGRP